METNKTFIHGFNNGYLLARYEPTLLATVVKNLRPANDYLAGLFSGKQHYELEKIALQIEYLNLIRDQNRNPDRNFERDI